MAFAYIIKLVEMKKKNCYSSPKKFSYELIILLVEFLFFKVKIDFFDNFSNLFEKLIILKIINSRKQGFKIRRRE